ncbi:amino acid ABC transporter, periplasmic substrate-binding protein [Oxalobacteraceae bacterium IMCC9480]|nr:amino acid ABC transporter, periplasmic substrate-binding protein [Oxalobacteraceae bacterium IMCC9480]
MMVSLKRRTALLAAIAWSGMLLSLPAHADLDKIRTLGTLSVGVYDDNLPYSKKVAGSKALSGIDVDVAEALGKKMGLKVSFLPFPAGENLGDDLRNMVWKGHYLGYGPADVMLHVPVDPLLMNQNPQVTIFAPYHTDSVRLVRNVASVPQFNGIASMAGKKIGVEKISISAMVLLGEENGRYRDDVRIFPTGVDALEKLKAGELDGVLASRSEIESVLRDDPRFEMREVSFQRLPRKGWTAGLAVKKDNPELASALKDAMDSLFASGEMLRIFAKHGVQIVKP